MLKVGERKGFNIMYSSIDRKFYLENSEGDEVGSGKAVSSSRLTARLGALF